MFTFLSKCVYKMQLYLSPFYNILRQQKKVLIYTLICTALIYTLTEEEFLILASKHPTVLFTDHKPMFFYFYTKIQSKP